MYSALLMEQIQKYASTHAGEWPKEVYFTPEQAKGLIAKMGWNPKKYGQWIEGRDIGFKFSWLNRAAIVLVRDVL